MERQSEGIKMLKKISPDLKQNKKKQQNATFLVVIQEQRFCIEANYVRWQMASWQKKLRHHDLLHTRNNLRFTDGNLKWEAYADKLNRMEFKWN